MYTYAYGGKRAESSVHCSMPPELRGRTPHPTAAGPVCVCGAGAYSGSMILFVGSMTGACTLLAAIVTSSAASQHRLPYTPSHAVSASAACTVPLVAQRWQGSRNRLSLMMRALQRGGACIVLTTSSIVHGRAPRGMLPGVRAAGIPSWPYLGVSVERLGVVGWILYRRVLHCTHARGPVLRLHVAHGAGPVQPNRLCALHNHGTGLQQAPARKAVPAIDVCETVTMSHCS